MASPELRQFLLVAIANGTLEEDALTGINEQAIVQSGKIATSNLLSTYARRIKHTGNRPDLLAQTEKLVNSLRAYSENELSMISVYLDDGGYRVLLADSEEVGVIYWMKMLDRVSSHQHDK
ncbi:hypothetical protein [Nocardia niigatensis]|uniref:hypothetical protein n=1 Tax=Nocardia niigatensis TaxID=209249 RepID=UPI000595352C|nr:hypothetical protein [Nocardia niigatensis]